MIKIKSCYFLIFLIIAIFTFSVIRDSCFSDLIVFGTPVFIENLQKKLEKHSGNLENHEFIQALSIGKRDFSQQFRHNLAVTGTMHLVAISAFHTGIMVFIFGIFFKSLLFFVPLRPYTKNILLFFLKIAASVYYFFITGTSIPTLRSLVFMLFFDFFMIFGTFPHPVILFFVSLAATALLIPGSLLSMSFLMSALCVATVLKIWKLLPKSLAISLICVSATVNWILLVVSASLSGTFSVLSPFVNFFVIPVVSLSVPFVTLAQFLIPFSETAAHFMLKTADFLISPASFFVSFFAETAEKTAVPIVQVQIFIKIIFVASFFSALYFSNKIKYLSLTINILAAISFFFGITSPDEIRRSDQFGGKAFCVKESVTSGRIFFDKYAKNPNFNNYFLTNIERFSAECGITKVLSVHFPDRLTEKQKKNLRKKIRFKNAKFYSRE
jgi:Predicted membrane metal-binding protein